ncbi:MAG TPA: hypothetical protein ENJ09_13495 [Planctomycetes bacterium]|nr:hypothetical protein [Planctomycetota bacterium]
MKAALRPGLVRLAARRSLPPVVLAFAVLLLVALARRSSTVPAELPSNLDPAGVRRHAVWLAFAALFLPYLVHSGSRLADRWRRRDADWCAPTACGFAGYALSSAAGTLLGALVLLGVALSLGEMGAAGANAAVWTEDIAHPPLVLAPGDGARTFELGPLGTRGASAGAVLELHATALPREGPSADLLVTLHDARGAGASVRARIDGPRTLRIPLAGQAIGPVELRLERTGGGGVLAFPDTPLAVLVPTASPRRAGLALALRFLVLLIASLGVSMGLGAWMRPTLATALTLALMLSPLVHRRIPALPGSEGLATALERTLEGISSPYPNASVTLGSLAIFTLGVAGLVRGLARGRDRA